MEVNDATKKTKTPFGILALTCMGVYESFPFRV